MGLGDLIPYATGAGGALVVLLVGIWLLITGRVVPGGLHEKIVEDKDKQLEDAKQAIAAERQRADAANIAAAATRDLLAALHREVKT